MATWENLAISSTEKDYSMHSSDLRSDYVNSELQAILKKSSESISLKVLKIFSKHKSDASSNASKLDIDNLVTLLGFIHHLFFYSMPKTDMSKEDSVLQQVSGKDNTFKLIESSFVREFMFGEVWDHSEKEGSLKLRHFTLI
jgi:hypothetical protein